MTNRHDRIEFTHYYHKIMGYGGQRKSYNKNRHKMHFSALTNVLMKYCLCDIITWTFCGDESGPVPIHERRGFKVLNRTVSFLYSNGMSHLDFFLKTFHKMKSIKAVLDSAHHHFGKAQGLVSKPGAKAKHDTRLSDGLNRIWARYHSYSQSATKAIIGQTVMLAAYHIRCLLDVDITFNYHLMIHLTMDSQGLGDLQLPEDGDSDIHQLRVPLFLAMATSPLVLISGVQWHTKDISHPTMIGVSSTFCIHAQNSADILEKLWQSLGNQRPDSLAVLEKQLWRHLFSLAREEVVEEDFLVSFVEAAREEIANISSVDDGWFREGILTCMTKNTC
jgi:hypothetical protein